MCPPHSAAKADKDGIEAGFCMPVCACPHQVATLRMPGRGVDYTALHAMTTHYTPQPGFRRSFRPGAGRARQRVIACNGAQDALPLL